MNTSSVIGVQFSVSNSEQNKNNSYVNITERFQFKSDKPVNNGVYDPHMGTISPKYNCKTCLNRNGPGFTGVCPGHTGYIELRYPVIQKLFLKDIKKILKIICFNCGCILKKSINQYKNLPKEQRINKLVADIRKSKKYIECWNCKYGNPIISKDTEKTNPYDNIFPTIKYYDSKGKKVVKTDILFPHILREILERITDESLEIMGRIVHPSAYVLDIIKIPPATLRPNEKTSRDKKASGGITPMIIHIFNSSAMLPIGIPPKVGLNIDKKYVDQIANLNICYNNFIHSTGTQNGQGSSYNTQNYVDPLLNIKSKYGIPRSQLLGKRTFNVTRAVITGSPDIPINVVGIPQILAKEIQMKIRVQEYNIEECMVYYENGLDKYPGCTGITKKVEKRFRSISANNKPILEISDIIHRDLINDDIIIMNRQPTLTRSSMSSHKIRVLKDTTTRRLPVETQQINVMACPLYNADFDGDQLNGWCVLNIISINETIVVASVSKRFISEKTTAPIFGQAQDGVIASALMTRSDVLINRKHAMNMFENTGIIPKLDKEVYTGRELLSMLIKPINYKGTAKYFSESYAPFVDYDPSEINVEIKNGEIISGVLDKTSIGEGARNGVFHTIALEYGVEEAIKVIYRYQQMVLNFIKYKGFSLNYNDLTCNKKTREEIKKIEAGVLLESKTFTDKLDNNEIIPPIGQTVKQFYENQQISILNTMDIYIEPILKNMNSRYNNLFNIVMYGAKGKPVNLYNIAASIGQITINGERLQENLGFGRTSPFSPRFATDPLSRGHISNSYSQGQNVLEVFANSKNSRYDIVTKQLSTSVTGGENRNGVKSNESIMIDNRRFSYNTYGKIIQFAYGGNSIDPIHVVTVKYPTIMLNNKEMEERYLHKDYKEHFQQLLDDRDLYRKLFIEINIVDPVLGFKDKHFSPVDVNQIINNVLVNSTNNIKITPDILKHMVDDVDYFIDNLAAIYLNDTFNIPRNKSNNPMDNKEARKYPEHISYTFTMFRILLRSYLNPRTLEKLNLELLGLILNQIKVKYINSFIPPGESVGILAAQCISEPLTQYMLDSHHRSVEGGTKKDGLNKFRGILGVRDVDKITNPSMRIFLKDEFKYDKFKVQQIANKIETLNLSILSSEWLVFYEQGGVENPIHPDYSNDKQMITDFKKYTIGDIPKNLSKWCIMFKLNKYNIIYKNISMEDIIRGLQKQYPKLYFIYTPENTKYDLKIRVYFPTNIFKNIKNIQVEHVRDFGKKILKTTIRGLSGIKSVSIKPYSINTIDNNGSIVIDKSYIIETNGINLKDVVYIDEVDPNKTTCDNIVTTYNLLGVEAAQRTITTNLRSILKDGVYSSHYSIYSCNMSVLGKITPISITGIKLREKFDALHLISSSHPVQAIENAAANEHYNNITGVSAPLMIGTIPKVGTMYNKVFVDIDFVKNNINTE